MSMYPYDLPKSEWKTPAWFGKVPEKKNPTHRKRGHRARITRLENEYQEEIELLRIGLGDIQKAHALKNNIHYHRKRIEEIT
jgi:hypothetical protein